VLNTIVIVIDVIAALFLILTILLHSGRGSGLSDMFGGTSTLSGGTAMERTLDRLTVITALISVSAPSGSPGSGTRRGPRGPLVGFARPRRSGGTW
jgi:preprotein translocase subunit SecG